MAVYSHSRLSTFEQCPYKYKLKYIDKIIPEIKGTIETHLGSCVHEALEWLYTQVSQGKLPALDEVIIFYAAKWEEKYTPEIIVVKEGFAPKDYFNKGVQFLLDYYAKHQPFDDGTLEIEKKILIDLDSEGKYKLQGFVDRIAKNIETNEYEVHDYKTANYLPAQDKFENDRQLALYSIALKENIGYDKEVVLVWHYLAHGARIESRRTNEQLERLKQETIELIRKIENTTEFPIGKSILCGWCEYKTVCKEFAN